MNDKGSNNYQHYAMMLNTDGTSQADRLLAALRDDFCQVDELGAEALLAMAADYAKLLRFYGPDNSEDGDWTGFFNTDEAVIMSLILATDNKQLVAEFDVFAAAIQHRSASCLSEYQQSEIPNYVIAKKIDHWYCQLQTNGSETGQNLGGKIAAVIRDKLRRELDNLEQLLEHNSGRANELLHRDFHPFWFPSKSTSTATETFANTDAIILKPWKTNFYAFYNALLFLQTSARSLLPESLQSQQHDPVVGLYIAFISLRQKVQHKLNGFTARHRHFYYQELLQIRNNKAEADSAYLVLSASTVDNKIPIAAGTEFFARIGADQHEVVYAADHELMVTGVAVQQIYTLFWQRDALAVPENNLHIADDINGARQFVTAAKINHIPAVSASQAVAEPKQWVYPLFGAAKTVAEQRDYQDAQLGFAIASPVLLLKEGERHLELIITSHEPRATGSVRWEMFIEQLAEMLQQEDGGNDLVYRQDAFFKVFENMFSIQLTTRTGWHTVIEYLPLHNIVDPECAADDLKIQMQLSAKVPAIVAYDPGIHGAGFDTEHPVIRLLIKSDAYLYPYSLLQNIQVRKISLDVNVKGVRDFSISNHLGQLSTHTPFRPFGPLPAVGSYFLVGSAEAAVKKISRFDLNIEWGGLPVDPGGFEQYYHGYGEAFDNQVFEVQLTALKTGQWLPLLNDEKPRLKLFDTASDQHGGGLNAVDSYQRLSCQQLVNVMDPVAVDDVSSGFSYSTVSTGGYFKFTLSNPVCAFGHQSYPQKLAEVLTFNGRIKATKLHKAIPAPPYTPQINAINLDYQAATTIDFEQLGTSEGENNQDQVYHLHPFGWQNLATATDRIEYLLPRYQNAGNLFIGLSAKECSGNLSLLFHLSDDSLAHLSDGQQQVSQFSWYYLRDNQWLQFDKRRIIVDSTRGFLTSGTVILDIPQDINRNNSIMPSDLLWLRVTGESDLHCLCSVYGIYAHGLQVSYKYQGDGVDHLEQPLPSGSIASSKVSISGIAAVSQVTASFDGKPVELDPRLTIRCSERLRHKNRATTAWDYERLILQRFPQIFKVKCFANMVAEAPQQRIRPGHVLIVVIPGLTGQTSATLQPLANDLLLLEIAEYVKTVAAPQVKVTVRNPVYEKIQVRFAVEFSQGKNAGYYINALNQAICDYLSPWESGGYSSRFGWCIRGYDLESYLGNFDYVDYITKFSMIQLTDDNAGKFRLLDTATDLATKDLHPVYPWSIAVPMERHFIRTINEITYLPPKPAGLSELTIGRTFIIAPKQNYGEEK